MKLSIIVPVYNDELNIERAINSLLFQTEKVKIIVVDDGSTDKTKEIVNALIEKNSNIEYYCKDNSGIADARNYGISKVDTEYFGFLDSDDSVKPNMAETMIKEIEDTNSDICMSNFTWVYENGNRKKAKDIGYRNKHEILEKMFATLWNKIYRTSWFKATGINFPSGLRYEDASVLYRLTLYMDKVCYVDESFVDYYQRKGSITHTFNININDMIEVFKGIKQFYIEKNAYDEYKDEIEYLFIRFFLGNSYLRACRIKDNNIRKETLDKGWFFLNENYPNFKKNRYLENNGFKNKYFRNINKNRYYNNVWMFNVLYKLGLLK